MKQKDIVERLREYNIGGMFDEIANTIEALRDRVAELEQDVQTTADALGHCEKDRAVWIRRADKTWNEKLFLEQIAACNNERDQYKEAYNIERSHRQSLEGLVRSFLQTASCFKREPQ